jgi:hypothetical protein
MALCPSQDSTGAYCRSNVRSLGRPEVKWLGETGAIVPKRGPGASSLMAPRHLTYVRDESL